MCVREVRARETRSREIRAYKVHAREMHAREMHAYETHTYQTHARGIYGVRCIAVPARGERAITRSIRRVRRLRY
jgi:hypothetical protein